MFLTRYLRFSYKCKVLLRKNKKDLPEKSIKNKGYLIIIIVITTLFTAAHTIMCFKALQSNIDNLINLSSWPNRRKQQQNSLCNLELFFLVVNSSKKKFFIYTVKKHWLKQLKGRKRVLSCLEQIA